MADPTPTPPPPAPTPPPTDWFGRQSPAVRHMLGALFTVLLTLALTYAAAKLGVAVPPVPTIPVDSAGMVGGPDPDHLPTGWYSDSETVTAARAGVPTVFRGTPAGADEAALPKDVFQWKVYVKATGHLPPSKDQGQVGSCVGFGSTSATEHALACAIAAGQPFEFTEFDEEITYAGSRVQVGNGQLRGDDGSVGGWAAKFLTQFGPLPKGKYPEGDFTAYNPTRCRQLGDKGVPASLLVECLKYRVGDAANLKTWTDVKKALANGNGVFTCSKLGFVAQRDSNGVARQSGLWGHCICLNGYHVDANGKEYGHFDNSWDSMYHKGPVGWGDPPGSGFWAESSVIGRMLAEGDSWAVSAAKGFPKVNTLDWFSLNERPTPHRPLKRKEFAPVLALAW